MAAPTQASHRPRHPGALPGWGKPGGGADHPDERRPGPTPGSGSRGASQDPASGGVDWHSAIRREELCLVKGGSRSCQAVREYAGGGGFSCSAPPSRHTSPRSAPCPARFSLSPLHSTTSSPSPLHTCTLARPPPAAPASTPSPQTRQPVVVGGGSQRMPSLSGQRRSNWHLSDSCSPF